MRLSKPVLALAALLTGGALSACGNKSGASASASAAPAALPATAVTDANAAVPAEMKDKLKFVAGKMGKGADDKGLTVQPDGWEESKFIPGDFKPPSSSNLGFMTSFHVSSNCDGFCEAKDAKDWEATTDKVNFAQFKDPKYKVVKDEKSEGQRVLVVTNEDGKTYMVVSKWKTGGRRYYYCAVDLEKAAAPAAEAFEKACRGLTPDWW